MFANCSDGELRLVGGIDVNEGRLEVCLNNAWGSVCSKQFTKEEATVACYQLDPLYEPGTLSAVSIGSGAFRSHLYQQYVIHTICLVTTMCR